MRIKTLMKFTPKFIECDLDFLLQNVNDMSFTRFYLKNENDNSYFFKMGNNFYIVKANNYDDLEKLLVDKLNSNITRNNKMNNYRFNMKNCQLGINDLVNLYKFNNNIGLINYFSNGEFCNYSDFLNLVKNVLLLEREMIENNIDLDDKYNVIKYIYDKYKMVASYWDPVGNYGCISAKSPLMYDQNRVVDHPYDYLGLINEEYATCEGLAKSLIELYRYFGIDAELITGNFHGVCKINLKDDDGQRKVTYIDLSQEITRGFQDNKYEYHNHVPYPRRTSNRIATPNSYNFFMKKNAGSLTSSLDRDWGIAVDYKNKHRMIIERERPDLEYQNNNNNSERHIILRSRRENTDVPASEQRFRHPMIFTRDNSEEEIPHRHGI